jgi:transposase
MRKRYDNDFKVTMVELLKSGRKTKEISEEYGIASNMLRRWFREYDLKEGNFNKKRELSSEEQELRLLRKELRETKLERDILKKAVGIFSKSDR